MPNPQWVISKYAKEGEGETFEVEKEWETVYEVFSVRSDGSRFYMDLPKSEYIPTTPPEQWEEVPIEDCITVVNGRCLVSERWSGGTFCAKNERFLIQDGKLVLQRRVSS